jgi:hypothetical protein
VRAVGLCVLFAGAVFLTVAPAFGMLDPSQLGGDDWWVWSLSYAAISVAVLVRYIRKE